MNDTTSPQRPRKTYERKSLSCTECTRRKLRCSKTIPCSACKDRGRGHLCRRRQTGRRPAPPPPAPPPHSQPAPSPATQEPGGKERQYVIGTPDHSEESTEQRPGNNTQTISRNAPSEQFAPRLIDGVSGDFAVTLEFLALGRQRVLDLAGSSDTSPAYTISTLLTNFPFDPVVTEAQVEFIVDYHAQHLVWTHNVVHLPTFQLQVAASFAQHPPVDRCWPALYYAVLSHSLYHMDAAVLSSIGISESTALAKKLHRKSVEALYAADYMANHSLLGVQTLCLLIYVGHNLGQSDLLSVLLASGIRIAQCLGMHRLGSSAAVPLEVQDDTTALVPYLVDREVQCRVWWFLVRQDWLQIPFLNTYTIHPSQFNTPMPKNCLDDFESMVQDGKVVEQEVDTYTHGSFTAVLNNVSILIWKTQDRLCTLGHPSKHRDGLHKLYEEVLLADAEHKRIIQELPRFFRDDHVAATLPIETILHQKSALHLSNAHKVFTLHRHFQVISFKDPWFTYTKVSCLGIARRGLHAMLSLPPNQYTWIARNLWTVNTHVVTAAVWIIFEQLFNGQDANPLFDRSEMLDLARRSSIFLQGVQDRSQIAKRGARLLEFLLDMEEGIANGQQTKIDISDIVSHVQQGSESFWTSAPSPMSGMPEDVNWMSQGATSWEALIDAMNE